jgi:hypothetical protein
MFVVCIDVLIPGFTLCKNRFLQKCLYQVRVITVFTVFRLLTDFVCLYTYEFCLSLCNIVRSSVIWSLVLHYVFRIRSTKTRTHLDVTKCIYIMHIAEIIWKDNQCLPDPYFINSFTIFLLSLFYCRHNLCQVNRQFFGRTSWWSRYAPFFVWCLMEFRYPI